MPRKPNSSQQISQQKKAKRNASIYTIIGLVAGALVWFNGSSIIALYLLLLYPVGGAVLMLTSKESIRFFSVPPNSQPHILLGICWPAFTSLAMMKRYRLLDYSHYWLPFAIISLFFTVILVVAGVKKAERLFKTQVFCALIISLLYSSGCTVLLNCIPDDSYPMKFNTTVLSKYATSGKSPGYHLVLVSWQRGLKPVEVNVSAAEYSQTPVDGPVGVHIKAGLLHIPWFYVDLGD